MKSVRRVLHATIATMPYIFDVLVFLCLFVITFAIIGVHLFFDIYFEPSDISDTSGDDGRGTSINERIALRFNFKDIQASATSLIVLLTTENWPDVGRPAFDVAPISLIYFILFLMLAMLLILSVPISVTVDAYKRFRKKQVIKDRMTERRALLAAFHCLDTQRVGYLTSHQIDELLLHMLGMHINIFV